MIGKQIEQLFYNGITPRELCYPDSPEYKETQKLRSTLEEEFRNTLTGEQVKMLDDLKEYHYKLVSMENEVCYEQGLAFGIRITAEAFIKGKS